MSRNAGRGVLRLAKKQVKYIKPYNQFESTIGNQVNRNNLGRADVITYQVLTFNASFNVISHT